VNGVGKDVKQAKFDQFFKGGGKEEEEEGEEGGKGGWGRERGVRQRVLSNKIQKKADLTSVQERNPPY